MGNALSIVARPSPATRAAHHLPEIPLPAVEIAATQDYLDRARAEATRHKYDRDWIAFSAWCAERGQANLPASPQTLAVYLGAEAMRGLAPPTLTRKVSAIGYAHRRAGHEPPHRMPNGSVVLETLAGIRRSRLEPARKKTAAASVEARLCTGSPSLGKLKRSSGAPRRSAVSAIEMVR